MLKFMFNGIKDSEGTLNKCYYSYGWKSSTERQLSVYAKEYKGFSKEIKKAFIVTNDSDYMSDYVVEDKFNIDPDHQYFKPILVALLKFEERTLAKMKKAILKLKINIDHGLASPESLTYSLSNLKNQEIHIQLIRNIIDEEVHND